MNNVHVNNNSGISKVEHLPRVHVNTKDDLFKIYNPGVTHLYYKLDEPLPADIPDSITFLHMAHNKVAGKLPANLRTFHFVPDQPLPELPDGLVNLHVYRVKKIVGKLPDSIKYISGSCLRTLDFPMPKSLEVLSVDIHLLSGTKRSPYLLAVEKQEDIKEIYESKNSVRLLWRLENECIPSDLPDTVISIKDSSRTDLPNKLPKYLEELNSTHSTTLPDVLPSNLRTLYCPKVKYIKAEFPSSLTSINCNNSTNLPKLPEGLLHLTCSKVKDLPEVLPLYLETLVCESVNKLPDHLPETLETFITKPELILKWIEKNKKIKSSE